MKKTILITGGTGYIGSHGVVAFEQAGYKTVIVDNLSNSSINTLDGIEKILGYKPDFYQIDLRDILSLDELFKKYDFDGVVHFAGLKAVGESCDKPLEYFDNNIVGSLKLFELMNKYDVKNIIFSSSATVYDMSTTQDSPHPSPLPRGEGIDQLGISENNATGNTTNPYGTTKYLLEQILIDLSKFSAFKVMNLRYFNPIGAHNSGYLGEDPFGIPNNLLPYIMKVANGELKQLQVFGSDYDTIDGTGVRDYIDVVDLIDGHLKAFEKLITHPPAGTSLEKGRNLGQFEVYNLGVGKGVSVLEMISESEKVTGKKIDYKLVDRRPGDVAQVFCDPSKALNELGWNSETSLENSLKNSWKFYSSK
ncbi:MAG: UDP-glucose 4-epimerase GalE [Candidatus Gracilibacteria bacterium]|nr:UDP-glucose 4-epimerase GalE [Candidatus Gracilibacteria bacterium]